MSNVINVSSSVGRSKAGKPYTKHYVTLDDGRTVSTGFKQPYKVGDIFTSEVEFKYGELQEISGSVASAAPAPASAPTAGRASSSFGPTPKQTSGFGQPKVFPVPDTSGEMAIIRQNALTNARELITCQLDTTCPATATKEQRRQHLDALCEDVMYVAYKFADFTSGHREVKMAREVSKLNAPQV